MPSATKRTSGETAVEYAVQAIKDSIKSGQFAPGQRLIASDLISRLGISAGPVREAVRKLTGEGLIEIQPHRGAVVRDLTRKDILEIYEMRAAIEGLAARLAAERINEGDNRKLLERAAAGSDEAFKSSDLSAYNEANHQFHDAIVAIANNQRVVSVAEQLVLPIYVLRYHQLLKASNIETSATEHRRIADAILGGEAERAERLMRKHVENSGQTLLETLAEQSEIF